jgi:hypothetical protein
MEKKVMLDKLSTTSAASLSLDDLARRIRDRNERMREHNADIVRLAMASGDDLETLRQSAAHGKWLRLLRQSCELGQRQAHNYVTLAHHRSSVEAYLHSCANLGRKPSIIGALRYISPPSPKPPKPPKQLAEIEQPSFLGAYLETHQALYWAALQYAATLKCDIEHRAKKLATSTIEKAVTEAQAALALLTNTSPPNLDSVRAKIAHVACLLDPTLKTAPTPPRPLQLDRSAFPKAMALGQPDLDFPEHAAPSTATIN